MMRTRLTAAFTLLGLLAAGGVAHGQRHVKVPAAEDTKLDILVKVPAASGRSMAVSESLGLLAVGHGEKHKAAQVSIFKLGSDGTPQKPPVTLTLPRPDALAKMPVNVLSVAFHPSKPLLYAWLDVQLPRTPQNTVIPLTPAETAALAQFDHLHIIRLDGAAPRVLVSLCRGEAFAHDRTHGSVCPDTHGRLYVPNVYGNAKAFQVIPGSYTLDAEGVPLVGKDAPEAAQKPGPFNAATAEASAKAISDSLKAGKPVLPQRVMDPLTPEAAPGLPTSCTGVGFVPVAKDVVLYGGFHDVAMVRWAPAERTKLCVFQPPSNGYQPHYLVAHPTLPVVYSAALGYGLLYRIEHTDGHLTLAPQTVTLVSAHCQSAPVVMAKRNTLAVGGHYRVFLLSLDAEGRVKPERKQVMVAPQAIDALAYSEKFDKLYVAVEPEKEKEKGK